MRKTITAITSVFLLLSVLSVSAFAGASQTPASQDVKKELQATAAYVTQQYLQNTEPGKMYKNAQYIARIAKSGIDCATLNQTYQADLKAELNTNGGRLLYEDTESAGSYALAIEALEAMGQNPQDFHGYDLMAALNGMKTTDNNLYMKGFTLLTINSHREQFTNSALEAALLVGINATYQDTDAGTGWDNWGINVDNNGQMIMALAPYYQTDEAIKTQIDKALAWNETMKTEAGYLNWGTGNANSTALALGALCAVGDSEKAAEAYALLQLFQSADTDGAYDYAGSANLFATADALTALSIYYDYLAANEDPQAPTEPSTEAPVSEPSSEEEPTTGTGAKGETTTHTNGNGGKGVPATGDSSGLVFIPVMGAVISGIAMIAMRKKKEAGSF